MFFFKLLFSYVSWSQFPSMFSFLSYFQLLSWTHWLISKISHICQEICDIKSRRKPKSKISIPNTTRTSLDEGETDQNYTQEPGSNNSAMEGTGDEDNLGDPVHVRKLDLSHLCFSLNFCFLMFLSQFPSMFLLLTYFQSFFFLICWLPKTLKMKEKQDLIQLIQGTV